MKWPSLKFRWGALMTWLAQDVCSHNQKVPVVWNLIFCLRTAIETHLLLNNLLYIPLTAVLCYWTNQTHDITWWVKGTEHQTIQEILRLLQNQAPNYKLMCSVLVHFSYWFPISVANFFSSGIHLCDSTYSPRTQMAAAECETRFHSWISHATNSVRLWQK